MLIFLSEELGGGLKTIEFSINKKNKVDEKNHFILSKSWFYCYLHFHFI